jgi:CheY-like chemotaxis protein
MLSLHGTMRSVLIADDDPLVRESLGDCLGALGCRVATASGGREAITRLSADRVDILLSDVDMPDLTGFEILEWIRQHPPFPLAMILMSGRADGPLTAAARHAGAIDLLPKPVELGRVTALLAGYLR